MVISPNDFSLWARLTGNKYPSTPKERAQKGPEVQNFIQNLGKEGMLGGKEAEEPKKENNLGKKLATGALIAGGVAALGAAARDKRVQDVAQRAASTTKTKIDDFLSNLGGPRVVDRDVIDASYDITPDPVQQQSNVAPAQLVGVDSYTPAVEGKTFGTSGAVSKLEDIGDAKLRARRTYGPMIDAIQQKNPGINVGSMGRSMLAKAEQDRDYDIAYMVAKGQGKDDVSATQIARQTAGFPTDSPVGKPTPYREFLGEQRTGSIRTESIDNLLNLVKTGPQINLPESVQEPGALVQLAAGSTPSNKVPTMGPTIGGSTLTDQLATKIAVDNVLDDVREQISGTPVPITGVRIEGPSNVQKTDSGNLSGQRELPIIYSTDRETNQQMRRIEPTNEQLLNIKQEQGDVAKDRKGNLMITSPTYDSITGFKTPSSEPVSSTPLNERIEKAVEEIEGRKQDLLSSGLDPRTTRFDSARAAGYTSKSGIEPRITNPRFQENMNLGKTIEAAMPEGTGRVFFEQDESGKIIPQSVQLRDERRAVIGPDTKTIKSGGGYQPRGGVGSSIGAYGVEPSDFAQADITKKPTEISLPKTTRDKRGMSDLSNQAVIKLTGSGSKGTARKAREELSVRDPGGTGSISDPTKVNPGETFDVAREVQRIQSDATIAPEKRRLNKEGLNELVERVKNRRALNLPTNLKQSPFFYQNGD